ncbi:MAG: ion channel [Spirochaetota bacterium]|nr:ion channel [Spirochaetota bacterium]
MISKIFNRIINLIEYRTIRQFIHIIRGNFVFKLIYIGFIILLTFSVAIYYIEKEYITYIVEDGQRIEDDDKSSNIRTIPDSIWWALVTSTTVGYGDYFPKSTIGRIVGILLMFFGVALVGVITGNIASVLVEKQTKEGKGLNELKLKNHFIICGWKRDMGSFLKDIMEKNKSYLATDIVLINTAEPELIENLKMDRELKYINFIYGDYIDERILERANLKKARSVLVLADRLIQGSIQEVDSRTVMAIITIKSISKSIYTCAELIDSKFERYLRFSNCDEVILSSDYNKSLIANASAGSGISHVISELLNVNAEVTINTIDIPKDFIGKSFSDLFNYYIGKDRSILIGILENTGNFFMRKREALQEAQKTPDISKLVDNLKMVKSLLPNLPVINPQADYLIKKYSKAIIIDGRDKSYKKYSSDVTQDVTT